MENSALLPSTTAGLDDLLVGRAVAKWVFLPPLQRVLWKASGGTSSEKQYHPALGPAPLHGWRHGRDRPRYGHPTQHRFSRLEQFRIDENRETIPK